MVAAELEACRVPEDPAFPTPVEGYVVSFVVFDERGIIIPPHRFLRSLLRIMAFVTLCEAYLRIDRELDQWKYFFHVRCPQDPEAELMISGGVIIHVKAGHRVDPYLEIPMPRSMKGWRKKWFYLRNDAFAPPPAFTNGHPVPLPSWGGGVAKKDLDKLHPLRKNLQ
jgi:hypothetical protein